MSRRILVPRRRVFDHFDPEPQSFGKSVVRRGDGGIHAFELLHRGAAVIVASEREERKQTMSAEPAKRSILIVDDDVEILRFLRETLQSLAHCQVDTSPVPEQGFELALCKRYDLFIFDFSMPAMDCAVLYGLIRKVYDLAFTPPRILPPLILMSGNAQQHRAQDLLHEPGVRGLLPKPFSIERLLQTLETILPGVVRTHHPRP